MNLILIFENDFIAAESGPDIDPDNAPEIGSEIVPRLATITDHRLDHLLKVHKAKVGDRVRVGLLDGQIGEATIIQLNDNQAQLDIEFHSPPPPPLPLTLIVALPRPKMLRRILRSSAEMGIKQIYLINSYRVEKSYWQTPALQPDKIRDYLLQGLSQAKDTVMPQVHLKPLFKPFVEDELGGIIAGSTALVAHPGIGSPCPHQLSNAVCLAIGPEGGFIPYEVESLLSCGFNAIHLGPRILKVENAITAITAKLFD